MEALQEGQTIKSIFPGNYFKNVASLKSIFPNCFLNVPSQVSTGLFNTSFSIPRATSIPADNTEHKVSSHQLSVTHEENLLHSFVSLAYLLLSLCLSLPPLTHKQTTNKQTTMHTGDGGPDRPGTTVPPCFCAPALPVLLPAGQS